MKNYVVIDFETTGLDYRTQQVIEVALIKLDQDFTEIGSFHTLVKLKKGKEITDFIKNLTGLTEECLANGMREEHALFIVEDFIEYQVAYFTDRTDCKFIFETYL